MGNVTPSATVTVKPMIDGQLVSVDFKEGATVQAGQLLATIDPRPYQAPLVEAEAQLSRDEALLQNARVDLDRLRSMASAKLIAADRVSDEMAAVAKDEAQLKADQSNLARAKLVLSYTRIVSPITGVAGLRQVDAGNIVHPTDLGGIVVITQVQPIAVVFTIPEDRVPEALARLRSGANITVEAWNRDASRKLATGRLTAVDNQIDVQTGSAKLKAVFDNKDGALISGAFVNVRMFLDR
jgi:multidrug efflux system membrane fusion protein